MDVSKSTTAAMGSRPRPRRIYLTLLRHHVGGA